MPLAHLGWSSEKANPNKEALHRSGVEQCFFVLGDLVIAPWHSRNQTGCLRDSRALGGMAARKVGYLRIQWKRKTERWKEKRWGVRSIFLIRGYRVMLDADLADLYGVETRSLLQAVQRNLKRFPHDFMFRITHEEFQLLRSQIVISKGRGGRRYLPYVFTEQGVAMLSSVLHSDRAIQVNIAIMRIFVRLREMMATHKELASKLKELETRIRDHDEKIVAIFDAIRQLMAQAGTPRKKIGFQLKEKRSPYMAKAFR